LMKLVWYQENGENPERPASEFQVLF